VPRTTPALEEPRKLPEVEQIGSRARVPVRGDEVQVSDFQPGAAQNEVNAFMREQRCLVLVPRDLLALDGRMDASIGE
jgi:hypothetical protein